MHSHNHRHSHDHHHAATTNLGIAFLLNLAFTALEIVGGLWTNSVAILSDAVHDAGDCLSLGIAWRLQGLSQRDADERFPHGYHRLSSLGALITGCVLLLGLGFVLWEAVHRLREPVEVRAGGVIALALVGVAANGAAALRLRGGTSLNEQVASWHLIEDALGWIAVLVGGVIMAIWDLPIVDPLLSLGIALWVLRNVAVNLKRVALVFLQAAPSGFDAAAFDRQVAALPRVVGCHDTRTWTLDGERHVLSTHLVLAADSTREHIVAAKRRVHELLREQAFEHITIEVELEGEACSAESQPCAHEHNG
jgi:cobalt-zinc-cadmium efflux system protein